jgi:hypothetical protein
LPEFGAVVPDHEIKPVAISKTIRLVFGLSVLAGEVGERDMGNGPPG